MPVVKPFPECIARPCQPGQPARLLIDHLEAVAFGCGDPKGPYEDRLAFLAGLAHDAVKATAGWQHYIQGCSAKGPPHAPAGAALFAFWAEGLIPKWVAGRREREQLFDLALDWVRVICHHHGAFDDLSVDPPWESATAHEPSALLAVCDRNGLDALVRKHFPETQAALDRFDVWSASFDQTWRRRQEIIRNSLYIQSKREGGIDRLGLRLAGFGARLIFADRRHVAEWKPVSWAPSQAEVALIHFAEHCRHQAEFARRKGVSEALLEARRQRQSEALESYRDHKDSHIFTLLLPTGYGKTLAGLRVALEAIRSGRCRRILYVAPYISILSQSAGVLEKATGVGVVLHHQMSILSLGDVKPRQDDSEDVQREDHQPYDLLDTWQAPIVATTFNQLFRALFPARAQQCLRIPALDGAFVFIDEPQIVDPVVWSAFLRALAVVARQRRAQVLFCTATLPPLDVGLGDYGPAHPLVGTVSPAVNRFVIRSTTESWDVDRVAHEAQSRLQAHGSVAVILNTVRDAFHVFRKLKKSGGCWYFLASRMLPGHKERIIRRIRKCLRRKSDPVGVVCTQVLEAGVDLSFRAILRARSVFSSIVQTAGRANRHGEGAHAEVIVFPFVREDGKDSRWSVYRDSDAIRVTDDILNKAPKIAETDVAQWLDFYYRECWKANPHTTSLQSFEKAAMGQWSELAKKEPFQEDLPGLDVFVPGAERFLPKRYQPRLRAFGVETAEQLLERYLDRDARRGLRFEERRLQSALLRQFLVDVPKTRATEIAHPLDDTEWPLVLDNPRIYRKSTGLAHLLAGDNHDEATHVF